MNKLIIGLVVLLAVGGGLYYFTSNSSDTDDAQSEMTSEETRDSESRENTQDIEESFTGSFAELTERGGSYRCTFTHESEQAISSGTIYAANDMLRGDFTSETQGMEVESHMIRKDGYVYTWSSMSPQGFKMAVSDETDAAAEGDAATSGQYMSMDEEYEYECEVWNADSETFALPDITFMDAGAYQQ